MKSLAQDKAPKKAPTNSLSNNRPTAIDIFSGAGGLSLGFEQAGFDIVSAVDIDAVHAGVHKYNFPHCKIFREDIANISGGMLLAGHDSVDAMIGGPPCQGFSLIGKRDMRDPRNELIMQFMRIVTEIKPRYFIMENVAGITIGNARGLLDDAIAFIEKNNYSVVKPYMVLNAIDYGIPQSRKRLFLLGYRNDQAAPYYPSPVDGRVFVEDAIGDLPNIDLFDELLAGDSVPYVVHPANEYAKMLHSVDCDPDDFSTRRFWNPDLLTGCLRTVHTEESKARFSATKPGQIEPISRFLKLDMNGYCNTLRAGTDKSRGAYTSPRPIHPLHNRCISVREAQRLHSYPDWFRMHTTKWHGFREVGNSVPPKLARSIGQEIMKALGITPSVPDGKISLGDLALLSANTTDAAKILRGEMHG